MDSRDRLARSRRRRSPCAAGETPRGQQPRVTFRTETNFVEVHAIVTDEKGAFVKDLTREDFEVYEDGRLQAPTVFSLVDVPLEQPFIPLNASVPIEPDVRQTTRTFDGRIYILLLDDLHTNVTRTNNVREVAKKFINEYLGVNDLAAVVYTSGRQESGQELTNNRRLLKAAIDRFQGQKLPSAGAEKLALHRQQIANEEAERGRIAGDPHARGAAAGAVDPRPVRHRARGERPAIAGGDRERRPLDGRRAGTPQGAAVLQRGLRLRHLPAVRHQSRESSSLVAEAREAVAAAQRANVNVYGIDPRGMSQFGEMIEINDRSDYPQLDYGTFRGQLRELLLAQESLISLSDETGGIAIVNSGDLAGGLGRIVLDNSRYYVLGYYSDSAKWSRNKFLKIEVKVKRPGLRVRARKGFLPPDTRAIARAARGRRQGGHDAGAQGRAEQAGADRRSADAGVCGAAARRRTTRARSVIAIEIDGPALKFQERDGRFVESVEVSIVAADQRARVQGGDRQTFNLNLMPETHARVEQDRRPAALAARAAAGPLPDPRRRARGDRGRRSARVPYDVEVPDYAKTPFALSGVLLTSSSAGRADDGQPGNRLERAAAVAAGGDADFSPSETLTWFAEVYDNSGQRRTRSRTRRRCRTRATGARSLTSRDNRVIQAGSRGIARASRPTAAARPDARPLRAARRGDINRGGQTAQRDVLFEVKYDLAS